MSNIEHIRDQFIEEPTDLSKLSEEIFVNKTGIIDDFCIAYLASLPGDMIRDAVMLQKVELVEEKRDNPHQTIYYFRIKE